MPTKPSVVQPEPTPAPAEINSAPTTSVEAPNVKRVEVAVGILIRTDGALLLSTRPEGKAYAGYWEFPGGKIEANETVEQALRRELTEELGIIINDAAGDVQEWKTTEHDYPHAQVRLHWCKVFAWTGHFEMREGQQMAWQQFPLTVAPVLPGAYPVLDWIAQERGLSPLVR
jgi:8-oxo-dGTP diphosphatase